MSTYTGAAFGGSPEPGMWRSERRRHCGRGRWRGYEIAAMVLGFIVFWPIGLAILGFKMWQKRSGYQGDLATAAEEGFTRARDNFRNGGWCSRDRAERHAGWSPRTTGNTAFDDWRSAELARLEEERRKLEAAEREFADYINNLRRAKDREDFDRFMRERGPSNPPANPAQPLTP